MKANYFHYGSYNKSNNIYYVPFIRQQNHKPKSQTKNPFKSFLPFIVHVLSVQFSNIYVKSQTRIRPSSVTRAPETRILVSVKIFPPETRNLSSPLLGHFTLTALEADPLLGH